MSSRALTNTDTNDSLTDVPSPGPLTGQLLDVRRELLLAVHTAKDYIPVVKGDEDGRPMLQPVPGSEYEWGRYEGEGGPNILHLTNIFVKKGPMMVRIIPTGERATVQRLVEGQPKSMEQDDEAEQFAFDALLELTARIPGATVLDADVVNTVPEVGYLELPHATEGRSLLARLFGKKS